jgi:hypothetical protein
MVPWDSPERGGFGNHAFARNGGNKILDACGGPHTGSETPEQYVDASIDSTPALYGGRSQPGKASDIVVEPDITEVE